MKRLLIAAGLLLASLLPAAAQGAQPWTIHRIAERWSYEEVPVPEIKGKPGIADFAVAFADKYPGYVLTDEIKNYLTVNGHEGEDVDGFVLDKAAGYLGIDFVSDATLAGEMCFWNVKNGRQRFAVKVADFVNDSMPWLFIYEYDRAKGALVPHSEEPVGFVYGFVLNFVLPRQGKDIEVVNEYGPSDWIRFNDETGVFTFESSAPAAVGCFISDKSATNVRNAPGGTVVGQIPNRSTYSLSVYNPTDGWWQILNGIVYEDMDGEDIEFEGDVWVHGSVLGIGTRNYGGETLELRAEPREDAAVSGRITEADATVRPLDMTEDGEWVKVSWNGQTGWIDSYWLCANTLTTCA